MQIKPELSLRGKNTPTSAIRELTPLAEAAKANGTHVYHINIGDPDFPIPDGIKQSMRTFANEQTKLPYPAFRGQKRLLAAWKKYYKDINVPLAFADEELIVTAGASNALLNVMAAIADPGEEILVFEPFYAPYVTYAGFVSATLVAVPLDKENGYHLPSKEIILSKITSRTKAILFTNPNNPTGTVFRKEEIEILLEIAREHGLFLISDETYRGIAFDNRESISTFHLAAEEDLQSIIIVDSVSKRLNVCGARIGVIVSKNKDLIAASFRFTQGIPFVAYMEQEIVADQLSDSVAYIQWLSNQYQQRRDTFITALKKQLELDIPQPEGAFYTMIELPIDNCVKFAKWLLTDFKDNNETVMVSPGSGFYATPGKGEKEVRVAYVLEEKQLERSAELLAKAVKEYTGISAPQGEGFKG